MNALTIGDTSWSLGVLIGAPILALLVLLSIGWMILMVVIARGEDDFWLVFSPGPIVLVITLAIAAWAFYPYSAEYHQWREVGGTTASVDKRLISDGNGGMEDKFVVTFEGSGQQYGCDDTRCAGLRAGDNLHLSCKRAWQFTGTDGYDCRFVSMDKAVTR